MGDFRFRQFAVRQDRSALKVGTDAVLLGASMTLLPSDRRLLDVGTGTGVIALMAAQRLSGMLRSSDKDGSGVEAVGTETVFSILGIDSDAPSAEEAAQNFAASPWSASLESLCVPLQGFGAEGTFDLIFSNPPFYDNSLVNPDAREAAARHTDSLSYRDIFAFASDRLSPGGRVSLILPSECGRMLLRTAASFGLYPFRILQVRTTAARPPRRIIAEFSFRRGDVAEDSIVLQDGSHRTEAYSELTGDFYLQL